MLWENENAFLLYVNVRSLTDQQSARKKFWNTWEQFLERNLHQIWEWPSEKPPSLLIPLHLKRSCKLVLNCDSYHVWTLFACVREQYTKHFYDKFIMVSCNILCSCHLIHILLVTVKYVMNFCEIKTKYKPQAVFNLKKFFKNLKVDFLIKTS